MPAPSGCGMGKESSGTADERPVADAVGAPGPLGGRWGGTFPRAPNDARGAAFDFLAFFSGALVEKIQKTGR